MNHPKARLVVFTMLLSVCIISVLFFSCKNDEPKYWSSVGFSLNQWECVKPGLVKDSVEAESGSLYRKGSSWEMTFKDSLSTKPEKVCWIAPDILQFELLLNDVSLVKVSDFTVWPSSFSKKNIFIGLPT